MDGRTDYDQRFISRLRARDERAFTRLVLDFQDRIFAFCQRMLSSYEEARDVAQDVFVSAFNALPAFRGDSKISTWLFRIATNHCRNRLDYLRRRSARQRMELSEILEPENMGADVMNRPARPDRLAEGHELEVLLAGWIDALEDEQREVLVLRDIQQLSYQEIVDITGLPLGTVKSRIHRARLVIQEKVDRVLAGGDPAPVPRAVPVKVSA